MVEVDWEELYLQLYAYADQLLKAHKWFRGKGTDSYLEGRQPHDYVIDAIEKYLKAPEKYDPSYNRSLVNYLKLHIIRTAIGNDSKKSENLHTSDVYKSSESDEASIFLDSILPYINADVDQQLDFDKIMNDIFSALPKDEVVSILFEGICKNGLKRREVIEEYKITDSEYDNGFKRLKTILKRTVKKYQLTRTK